MKRISIGTTLGAYMTASVFSILALYGWKIMSIPDTNWESAMVVAEICGNGIDDDGDGLTDCEDPDCWGNQSFATGVASQTGVFNASNATSAPDGAFAEIYDIGDYIVLDLGFALSAGDQYALTWHRKSSYSDNNSAEMLVEESADNSTFTTHPVTPSTTSKTAFVQTTMIANVPTRYLKLRELTSTGDDFVLDAVTVYNCGAEICGNGIDDDGDGLTDGADPDCPSSGMELIPAGSYIIDMGVTPQTTNNALKPYGLVWELLHDHHTPVKWSIAAGKSKDGVDFNYNGSDFKGGPFIILAGLRTPAVDAAITSWEAQGVVGVTTTSDFMAPIYRTLNYSMIWTLDQENGHLAEAYLIAAGIPSSAYNWVVPGDLSCCNDVFVLPHASPTWAVHGNLLTWNDAEVNGGCAGAIWAGCRAVSNLENITNPADPNQRMNFLMSDPVAPETNPAVPYDQHNDGTLPPAYLYAYPGHPVMQFMGLMDGAQENGSEQIYLPTNSWRPTTKIGVWDDDQPDIPGLSPGPATKVAFGFPFGDTTRGYMMYQAGHKLNKNSNPEDIAAQRAFFNFSFMAAGDKAIQPLAVVPDTMAVGENYSLSVSATGGSGNYYYSWSSDCGGIFSDPNAASTTFTAPAVTVTTTCHIKVTVTDDCGTRTSFQNVDITVLPTEICSNGIDDDGDGLTDGEDPDCGCSQTVMLVARDNAQIMEVNLATEASGITTTSPYVSGNLNALAANADAGVMYYASGQIVYYWKPATNTHGILLDLAGQIAANESLSSGAAEYYNGFLYLGTEDGNPGVNPKVYRLKLTDNGLSPEGYLVDLNIPIATNTSWGDLVITTEGGDAIIYGMTSTGNSHFWRYNLMTAEFAEISTTLATEMQIGIDINGDMWAGSLCCGTIQKIDRTNATFYGDTLNFGGKIWDLTGPMNCPQAVEICDNGIDDDGDGSVDENCPTICDNNPNQTPVWAVDHDSSEPGHLRLWTFTDYDNPTTGSINYGELWYFNTTTGTMKSAGDAGDMEAMAVNKFTGQAYFLSNHNVTGGPTNTQALWTYDLKKAAVNSGNIILTLLGHVTKPTGYTMNSLAYDPATGNLFTADPRDANENNSTTPDKLYFIDLTQLNANPLAASTATLAGTISGNGASDDFVDGLAFDESGNLYAVDGTDKHLYRLDAATGAILAIEDSDIYGGVTANADAEALIWDIVNDRLMAIDNQNQTFLEITPGSDGSNVTHGSYAGVSGLPANADFEAAAMYDACPASRVAIGNLVFADYNRNGVYDNGEGIDNAEVQLFRTGNDPGTDEPLLTTTTSNNGFYLFENLEPGDYFIHLPASEFNAGSPMFELIPVPGAGGDIQQDDDVDENGLDPANLLTTGVSSGTITLTATSEPVDTGTETGAGNTMDNAFDSNGDMTVDFCFYSQEICYNGIDEDGDGLVDCDDPDCDGSISCSCILFQNGGFDGSLSPWQTSGSVSMTADGYNGTTGAAIDGNGASIYQTQTGISPGTIYTLTAFAKIENTPNYAAIGLRFFDGSMTQLSESLVEVTSAGFIQYSTIATAPANVVYIQAIALKQGAAGVLKIDEMCLSEFTPQTGDCILVVNPGFELGLTNWNTEGSTVQTTTDAHSGGLAAEIKEDGSTVSQQVAIQAGQTYELTTWAKVSGNPELAEIYMVWKDINSTNLTAKIIQPVNTTVTQWMPFTLKGKAPAGAVYAEIGAYKEGNSSKNLLVDDFCFSLTDTLGGTEYDLSCGCSDNLIPNGGYEESFNADFNYVLGGKPAAAIANDDDSTLPPWSAGLTSNYMFYIDDTGNTVNNPEGDYFVWLPNSGDCWISNTDFSNNLLLEDGETYIFCFYAASWAASLDNDGLPDGGTAVQNAGILDLEFTFTSGFQSVFTWSVPASESFNDLSWTKFEYTFTYDVQDPISNFVFTNMRDNVGMAIDAVTLSKVNCPKPAPCGNGGITYQRWGNLSGDKLARLLTSPDYPNNFDETGVLTSFQGPVNYDKNYGTRVFGYLLPAQTGTYYFNVTSDDNSRLYLSPDSTFIAKQLIAEVPGKTKKDEHDKYNSQTSGSINLNAGSKYYIELIHKEKKDDDHFQVYWKGPGIADWTIIPGTALEPICHEEICYNGLDDDNDGLTDCADPDCGTGLSQNYSVTDENCGSQQGAIDLQVDGTDMPFSYSWSDLPETARWTFEKTTDDVSGNNHHDNGTGGYPIFTHDAVDGRNSLYFDGSSYVRYSVDGGFMEVAFSKLSVSMWVKPTEYTGVHTLLDEGGSTNGYSLRINGDSLEFGVKNEGHLFIAGKHEFPKDGQWHHVAGVYDSGLLILYLDGVAGNSTTASFTTVKNHGSNGGFGATINGSAFGNSTDYFIGKMDDIRYYFERALTTAQITDLAKNDGSRSGLTAGVYNVTITSASGCSDTQQITVNSTGNFTDGGTIGGDETSCLTTYDPVSISTLTLPSPGAGPAEYRWQESTDDGATWSDIAGATGESYDPTPISAPTLYRRAARLVACSDWVYSNEISKSFTQNFDTPGSISGDESQCGAFDPAIINSTGAPTGGNGGATEYAWEKSTDGGATWNPIAGATAANFDPGTILVTTMYRRGARQANCENYLYTNAVVKTIVVNFDDPGAIVGDEDNCGSFDPGVIASVSQPSGGSGGTQEYQWQKSWDNVYWYDIAGANFETYDPSTITQTTYYRRGSRHQPCGSFLYSNTVTKMVAQNFSDGGYLSGDESVCGSFDPAPIVSEDPASGGAFGYQAYQWQQSPDGINWQNISGATSVTYDPGIISQTTLYRRQGRRLPCATWVNSNTITKTVLDYPLAQIQTFPAGTNGFICEKTSYSFGAADAGSGANYSWDFGPFATPQFANGTGPHSISFDVPQDSAFTAVNVRLTVSKNNCASTDATVFNIRPEIMVSSVITTDPTSCAAANGQISVSVITPPGASLEATVDGTNWTAPPFDFLGLGAGIYEIRLRYGANECEQSYGTVILNEPSNPTAALTLSATEGCTGTNFTMEATPTSGGTPSLSWDFGPDATPATATGAGPHTVTYATGGNKTISLTLLKDGCQGFADTTISVVENFTGGGTIEGDEDLCENATPSEIISTAAPSGGTGGTIAYQWEKHQDDGTGGWTTWTDIAGATAETLTPASISITTQYRRKARRSPCGSWQLSNIATKNYVGAPIATDDYFASACPGFMYFDNVSDNDANLFNAVYSVVTPPTNGTVDLDAFGEFIYTPNATFCGFDYFTYSVCNNGTGCCDIATASINLTDKEAPVLQNIPADVTVHCDDEIPLPPTVNAWENCQSVSLSIDEVTTLGMDSCSVYSYQLTRIWTSADYCGNSQSDQQVITIQDVTAPDIYRVYTLPNGKRMIAGVMENVTQRWKTVSFPIQFTQPPILLAQVVTNDDGAATTYRLRNVSTTQFQVRLQEEEGADGTHSEESIAWIAIEKGSNAAGLPFEAGSKLVSSSSTPIAFAQSYTTPGLIGNIQTFNENNPAALRMNTLTATGADVFCQEETSLDPETNHGLETVSYLVLGGTGDFATKSGEVFGETGQVTVNDTLLTVSLNHLYHNPVVVLGGLTTNDGQPATIRVQDVTPVSFRVFIKNWDYLPAAHADEKLTWLVVEGSIPFDQTVECSAIPAVPGYGTEIFTVDNCDNSVPLTITDSPFGFNCTNDTTYTRNFYAQDECGNITSLTQTFILRDTTPPTFTVPADVTLTCQTNWHDLNITGDVIDEADNCADGLEATYTDNLSYLNGCSGYVLRIWSLSDHCNNTITQSQRITVYSDNDGDGDGIPDPFDLDDDNDGIPDVDETTADRDGDGIPNYLDLDSDNDGIPDIIEAGFKDDNGDGVADSFGSPDWDVDGDGLANEYDANDADTSLLASDNYDPLAFEHDRDGDGVTNTWDTDADNDGVPDLVEAGGVDINGDGVVDYPIPADPFTMIDGDGDGFSDFYDTDTDNSFGVDTPDRTLVVTLATSGYTGGKPGYSPDFDGDGVPDYLDLDSDNDGIPDIIESGGIDTDGNGRVDSLEFSDTNLTGYHDEYENIPLTITDTDGTTTDGRPEDVNADGTVYADDADFDGQPNRRDLDSDGDGILDVFETGNMAFDTDADGRIDSSTDTNKDGFADALPGNLFTEGDGTTADGRPEDGPDADTSIFASIYADGTFGELNAQPDVDDDGDNLPNFLDRDSDDDFLLDETEDKNGNGIADTGETDYLDRDTDDDLIIDGIEDMDRDGFYDIGPETNPLDPDTDDDTLMDGVEDANQDGDVDEPEESDPRDPCDPFLSDNCIGVVLELKVKLNGTMMDNSGSTLMRDDLRAKGLLPTTEPYSSLPYFTHTGGGGGETVDPALFDVTGPDAIVDWVFIELHDALNPTQAMATQSALVQRDGDIVSADGLPQIRFDSVLSEYYYVVVRHRNHLGVSTQDPLLLSPTPTVIDFTGSTTPVFGSTARIYLNTGEMALWAGEMNGDRKVIYQGPFNDVFNMFFYVMTQAGNEQNLANYISPGYSIFDVNMDGKTVYQGPGNDRSKILFFSIMMSPENSALLANFIVLEKLP